MSGTTTTIYVGSAGRTYLLTHWRTGTGRGYMGSIGPPLNVVARRPSAQGLMKWAEQQIRQHEKTGQV